MWSKDSGPAGQYPKVGNFYYSVAFVRLCLNQAKTKPPKQAENVARTSIGKSFFKNTSNWPPNKTLSPIRTIIGPAIHNPHRQDTLGQRKPNTPPPIKYMSPRRNEKGSMTGINGTRSP